MVGVTEDGGELVPGGRGEDDGSQDGHTVGCMGHGVSMEGVTAPQSRQAFVRSRFHH